MTRYPAKYRMYNGALVTAKYRMYGALVPDLYVNRDGSPSPGWIEMLLSKCTGPVAPMLMWPTNINTLTHALPLLGVWDHCPTRTECDEARDEAWHG